MITSQIRVLSKAKSESIGVNERQASSVNPKLEDSSDTKKTGRRIDLSAFQLKHESEANTFKLINERDWNIVNHEPSSETQFFCDGHPLMSVISVIGSVGVGKSSLLNKIANKYAFETHRGKTAIDGGSPNKIQTRHLTKGVDIHVTHHRILLDCQPILSRSVLEDFMSGYSGCQFGCENDPLTNMQMISLQLTAFLIATCDYVVIMNKFLVDANLMQLIGSALMMLGEGNYKAKLIMFSNDDKAVCERKFKDLTSSCLGMNQVDRYFSDERDLINYISSYTSEKCDQIAKDPTGLRGRKWLAYSRKLWSQTIKESSLFSDYAMQVERSNNPS